MHTQDSGPSDAPRAPDDEEPDTERDDDDEAPETPTDEPAPVPVQDPPSEPQRKGPYTVCDETNAML